MAVDALPEAFCWTRFGTEAGEPIERILARKEEERRANNGVFFWGIGNSVAPGLVQLIERYEHPEVLFSPIKSRPRLADISPRLIVAWQSGETLFGGRVLLPKGVFVTSRLRSVDAPVPHYALVCWSDRPLRIRDQGRLRFRALRNLRSGKRLGSSQVTAVVQRPMEDARSAESEYVVALRAVLAAPYFVRLCDPVPIER